MSGVLAMYVVILSQVYLTACCLSGACRAHSVCLCHCRNFSVHFPSCFHYATSVVIIMTIIIKRLDPRCTNAVVLYYSSGAAGRGAAAISDQNNYSSSTPSYRRSRPLSLYYTNDNKSHSFVQGRYTLTALLRFHNICNALMTLLMAVLFFFA